MRDALQLLLGTVNAVSAHASGDEIEAIYQSRLRPFIKVLYRFPGIKSTLYYSGSLLAWIEKQHSEFFDVLLEMSKRRQIEILGGGFYEPVFSLIHRTDSIGQVELLTTYIRKTFGTRPRGMWIPGPIWDSSYPSLLRAAGIEYTFLYESQFYSAGFEAADLFAPCLTEDQGKTLTVFPVLDRFSCQGSGMAPAELVNGIVNLSPTRQDGDNLPVSALFWDITAPSWDLSDAAFESWLTDVFERMEAEQELNTIQMRLPNRLLRQRISHNQGYFPPTSFMDVLKNQGLSEAARERYRDLPMPGVGRTGLFYNGIFRQALMRYQEVCDLYGKIQFVGSLVNQIRGDRYRKQSAKEDLWKAQNYTSLWHSPSGGVYRNLFRKQAYSSLLASELATREHGIFAPSITCLDVDLDGTDECLFQGSDLNAYVHLRGGRMVELDYLPNPWNYLDTMARYPEPFHVESSKGTIYDSYSARSFIDHFVPESYEPDPATPIVSRGTHKDQLYLIQDRTTDVAKSLILDLVAEGLVEDDQGVKIALEIRKYFVFEKTKITTRYTLTNTGSDRIRTCFMPEMNLSFSSLHPQETRLYKMNKTPIREEIGVGKEVLDDCSGLQFEDHRNRTTIRLECDILTRVITYPIYTCRSWNSPEPNEYQANRIFFKIPLDLEPGAAFECTFTHRFLKLR